MKRSYILPQTQAQTICVSQLMAGSYTPSMIISDDPISGSDSEGIIYGG